MNKKRRNAIKKICVVIDEKKQEIQSIIDPLKRRIKGIADDVNDQSAKLDSIMQEEIDASENVPETFLSKDDFVGMESNIEKLEECIDALDSVCSLLNEIIE